jgi:hypothetical protein
MVISDNSRKSNAKKVGNSGVISFFFLLCQVLFAISVIGKAAALIWHSQAFAKPDFILGISQIKVMELACLLELLIIALLGSKNIENPKKLCVLLAISSAFITYHVWAWVMRSPPCPCFGNLIAKETSAKISCVTATMLFLVSAFLLAKHGLITSARKIDPAPLEAETRTETGNVND